MVGPMHAYSISNAAISNCMYRVDLSGSTSVFCDDVPAGLVTSWLTPVFLIHVYPLQHMWHMFYIDITANESSLHLLEDRHLLLICINNPEVYASSTLSSFELFRIEVGFEMRTCVIGEVKRPAVLQLWIWASI